MQGEEVFSVSADNPEGDGVKVGREAEEEPEEAEPPPPEEVSHSVSYHIRYPNESFMYLLMFYRA